MADPIKTSLSLENLASEYSVFEPDQVLTEGQLNTLSRYFDDQDRLTRVELLGVGIVGGLNVVLSGGKVVVGKGVGITTDGDLMLHAADTTYDCIKPYDETAPVYKPFYKGEKMMTLFELVKEGESDVRKQDMSTLPGKLSDYAVLFYMESYEQDRDLCSGSDCDNLGLSAVNTPRLLLIGLADAETLLKPLTTASAAAIQLPHVAADRFKLRRTIDSTGKLAAEYMTVCGNIHTKLKSTLSTLNALLPGLLIEQFGSNPIGAWTAKLDTLRAKFADAANVSKPGIQYYYSFLKDIAETWNELRAQLFANDSVLCPDLAAFPKHLLLGALNAPQTLRTGLYPSPLTSDSRIARDHARFLVSKLNAMFNTATFPVPLPNPAPITISPSRDERSSLEEQAIPFYYVDDAAKGFHILPFWSYAFSANQSAERNSGYRWAEYTGKAAPDPYVSQIGRHDFFRIEGHHGKNVSTVLNNLKGQIETHNLPFTVHAVLLHGNKGRIVIRPPRYRDLHRFHYLMRKDVEIQLNYSKKFSEKFRADLISAAGTDGFPSTIGSQTVQAYANEQHGNIVEAVDNAAPAVGKRKYSEYRQAMSSQNGNWKSGYKQAINTAGNFKRQLSNMMRTDFATPFDTLFVSNQSTWLNWLDLIIDRHEEREDDKLLLPTFFKLHPGMEHCGGVTRGGTFVLVYDDNANVVADFMLPYYLQELGEEEPEDEPDLPIPDFRLPDGILDKGFTFFVPPEIRWQREFLDIRDQLKEDWKKELDIQTNYMDFFTHNIETMGDIFGKFGLGNIAVPGANVLPNTGDAMLDTMLEMVGNSRMQIEQMMEILAKDDLSGPQRAQAEKILNDLQATLGANINIATDYMVEAGVDIGAGQPAAGAVTILSNGMRSVTSAPAKKELQGKLKQTIDKAPTGQKGPLNNMMNMGGLAR